MNRIAFTYVQQSLQNLLFAQILLYFAAEIVVSKSGFLGLWYGRYALKNS